MNKKIYVDGMTCGHCASHVKEALTDIGAYKVVVDLDENVVIADVDEEVGDDEIKCAIEDAGYDVVDIEEV